MREVKFQFLYKGPRFSSDNDGFNWHKKIYTLDELIHKPLRELSDVHRSSELVAKRQYTGLKDKNGVEIYEGDILRIDDHYEGDGFYQERVDYIVFDSGCFCFNGCGELCESNTISSVIGNIHENPELLNKD